MKVLDSKTTNMILSNAGKITEDKTKLLYIFAGPNGSGKSTLIANGYIEGKLDVEYVNADLYCRELFSDLPDENERNIKAMYYCINKVENYINEGRSFCYETVLSHPSKLELIEKAKANGYKVISTFVYTSSPDINIARVAERAKQGGHNVPKDKIISRYHRSLELSKELEKLSNEFSRFDNSKEMPIEYLNSFEVEKLNN